MHFQPVLDLINATPRDLILPPSSLFLLVVAGLLIRRRWPRTGRAVAATAFAALAFLSSAAGSRFLVEPLERQAPPLRAPERARAQAIVVLAAGRVSSAPEYGGRDVPDYVALARLRYAAHLQRRTGLPILVAGGNGSSGEELAPKDRAYTKADAMALALRQDFGVPVQWVERRSRDTGENARFSAAVLHPKGIKRILLVTDAMHIPRAGRVFTQAGFDVVGAPTMFLSVQELGTAAWMPSAEGMRRSWYAIYELLGAAWYRLRHEGKDTGASPAAQPAQALAPADQAP